MPAALDEPMRRFLNEPNVGVLATVSPRGRLQATPVWFLLEGDELLVNTSRGRVKLRNLEKHPYMVLTIIDPKNAYRWAQIQGRVIRFDNASGARDIDRLSLRYLGKPYPYFSGDKPENRVSIVIRPFNISGAMG